MAAGVRRVTLEVGGPAAKGLRRDTLALERVDALEQTGQQARGVAADLLPAKGELVDALEQDREPVRGADGLEERVEARIGGVFAQEAFAQGRVRADPQLLERDGEQRLDPLAKPRRRGGCAP